jgi:lipopolysaccharide heptosyltransferase II
MSEITGALASMEGPIERVAIVRATRLGDFMCAVPVFRSLRQALPKAEITLIALPFARELVQRYAYLDRWAEYPGYPGTRVIPFYANRTLAFLNTNKRRRYDLAIQLHGSGVFTNPLTLLLGARHTVGFTRAEDHGMGLDYWTIYPDQGHEIHRVWTMAALLGTPNAGTHLDFPRTSSDRDAASDLLRSHSIETERPLIGVHPGAKNPTRRWPPGRFAAAVATLAYSIGAEVVVTGGANEARECETVAKALGKRGHNLNGQTTIGSLAALMERMSLFLTNDTGPAHIAYAVGVPSVTIFGAAEPEVWGPLDSRRHKSLWMPIECRPCGLETCSVGYRCLTAIIPQDVVAAAWGLLGDASRKGRN